MLKNLHYLNGKWVRGKDLKISAFDITFLRGYGCFDVFRVYNKKPFMLNDHIQRFVKSSRILGLKLKLDKKDIQKIIYKGIKINKNSELIVKMILTGGISQDSLSISQPTFIVEFLDYKPWPEIFYRKGIKVITFRSQRFLPEVKSTNYFQTVYALKKAKKEKAQEIIFCWDNKIYEGGTSSFFANINNKLITPQKDILPSITKKAVIQLAKKLHIEVKERDVFLSEIKNFKEAFICSSTREIMPVVKIDNLIVGEGRIGDLTKILIEEFKKLILKNFYL
jgi:branched-subunit amino acid aminotransferase/4-amino-4-deoxychorismate lyase